MLLNHMMYMYMLVYVTICIYVVVVVVVVVVVRFAAPRATSLVTHLVYTKKSAYMQKVCLASTLDARNISSPLGDGFLCKNASLFRL